MADVADEWVDVPPATPAPTAAPNTANDDAWVDVPPAGAGSDWSAAAKPTANSSYVGRVLNAFGETYGADTKLTGASEVMQGFFDKLGDNNPIKSFRDGVMFNTATMLIDKAMTPWKALGSVPAFYHAAQEALVKAGVPGELTAIPEAFFGTPHPFGMTKQPTFAEMAKKAEQTYNAEAYIPEWALPPKPLTDEEISAAVSQAPTAEAKAAMVEKLKADDAAALAQWHSDVIKGMSMQALDVAKDAGVIGPEKPALMDLKGKPVSEVVNTLKPQEGTEPQQPAIGEAKPPEVSPPTADSWLARFNHFVGRLEQPTDVQDLIRQSAEENDNFPSARQGELTLTDRQNLADAAGIRPDEIDGTRVGRFLKNDAYVRSAMQVMVQTTRNVRDAAKEVAANPSDENLIKFQEHIMRRDMAVEEIVGLRSEWGRVGNVFQEFMRDVKDGQQLDRFIKDTCPL